jgi:hypothetical protein
MPTPSRPTVATPPGNSSAFVNQPSPGTVGGGKLGAHSPQHIEPTPEHPEQQQEEDIGAALEENPGNVATTTTKEVKRKSRSGTINRSFKFPPSPTMTRREAEAEDAAGLTTVGVVTATARSSVEVPPPPPVEKEKSSHVVEDGDDDVGPTVEISLN